MSRFSDALRLRQQGWAAPTRGLAKITQVTDEADERPNANDYLHEYSLEARVVASIKLDRTVAPSSFVVISDAAKQYLVEEMFGEFREPLNDLRSAILEHDTENALRLLFQIERQMFSI